ncbi:MAG: hypothetical protein E7559_03255 [Ruminococcaceae bacterium]|nr:hypothetical protein [Oscillospiraceae bacterium]
MNSKFTDGAMANGRRWFEKFGKRGMALLLALMMLTVSLPMGGGAYSAYAEQLPAEQTVAAAEKSAAEIAVSAADAEQHVCVIRSFADHTPGEALCEVSASEDETAAQIMEKLPRKLKAVLECKDCPTEIKAAWQSIGGNRYELKLDEKKYTYKPLDDPETEDIDESKDSPWCDLPFVSVVVEADVSASDAVSGSDVVSGSDAVVSDSDIVSGSDAAVSDSDIASGSDAAVSGSDIASDSDAPAGIGSESQVLPLCTCVRHCYANPESGSYLVDIHCPACSSDPSACLVDPELTATVLEVSASDGRIVTVEGDLPKGASLSVEPMEEEQTQQLMSDIAEEDIDICFAYDIKVIYEGVAFQPAAFGETVKVSVHNLDAAPSDTVTVYHFHEDEVERISSELNEESTASFETGSFSYYVGGVEKAGELSTVYVFRHRANIDSETDKITNAAGRISEKMYFYVTEDGWKAHTNQLTRSDGTAFEKIEDVLRYYTEGDITFILQGTYIAWVNETIDGGDRNIVIKRHATHSGADENGIDIGYKRVTLTLRNVTIDGVDRKIREATLDQALIKVYNSGSVLNIQEGTVIQNANSNGVLIMDGGVVNMSGGEIKNCHADREDITTRGTNVRNGGGVFVGANSVFDMTGGTISGCRALDSGGGVYIQANGDSGIGEMTMSGSALITGCTVPIATASDFENCYYGIGGGVYVAGTPQAIVKDANGVDITPPGRKAPFARFTMNGGAISGNYAENGAGIGSCGIVNIDGGTISGNTAEDSGGGIWNTQTLTMTGGSILNNKTRTHSGGGIMLYSFSAQATLATTTISGGTISGNYAAGAGVEGGNGIMVFNDTSHKHHLLMYGTPTIHDVISLGIDSQVKHDERDISLIYSPGFNPGAVIKLAIWNANGSVSPLNFPVATVYDNTGGHSSGSYVVKDSAAVERIISKFTLVNPAWYLKQGGNGSGGDYTANSNTSSPYHIVIAQTNATCVYFNQNASTNGDGKTPATAFNNMASAYNALRSNGGTIYMVSGYTPSKNTTIGAKSFTEGSNSVTTNGPVQLIRYVKPSDSTYSGWAATNTGALLNVSSGITVSLAGVTLDGHNQAVTHQSIQFNAPALATATEAMITVANGGTLTTSGYVRLIDAPSSTHGGAIYAADGAVVNINKDTTFSGNSGTQVGIEGLGEAVYVGGDNAKVNLAGKVFTNDMDVHLGTAAAKVYISDANFTTEDGVLEVTLGEAAHCHSGRVVATYSSGSPDLAEILVSNAEVKQFNTAADGANVILPGYTAVLTAMPEFYTPQAGQTKTFTVDLAQIFENFGAAGQSVSMSAEANNVTITSHNVVDENKSAWRPDAAMSKFGFSADVNGAAIDASTGNEAAIGDQTTLVVKLHNANAITHSQDGLDTIELDIDLGGYVRTYTITLNAVGAAMSVTVPLHITGVVDYDGTFYLPTADAYQITNNSEFAVEVTDIEWQWEQGADNMFANVDAMSSQVKLGGSSLIHSFGEGLLTESVTDGEIAANNRLPLDWDMFLGNGNYIRSKNTEQVATIIYTIDMAQN